MVRESRDVSMANKRRYIEEKDTLSEGDDVEPDIANIHPIMELDQRSRKEPVVKEVV
jgi:hypothetical protein